jgi:hypothetical protein
MKMTERTKKNPSRVHHRRNSDYSARKFWEVIVMVKMQKTTAARAIIEADNAVIAWRKRWEQEAEAE